MLHGALMEQRNKRLVQCDQALANVELDIAKIDEEGINSNNFQVQYLDVFDCRRECIALSMCAWMTAVHNRDSKTSKMSSARQPAKPVGGQCNWQ